MTRIAPLPVGLTYIHPEIGHTNAMAAVCGPDGSTFYAILFTPGHWEIEGGEAVLRLHTRDLYLIIVRVYPSGQARELARFLASASEAWLRAHGGDPTKEQGKLGPCAIAMDGADLIVGINMRVNGCQTGIHWRMPGATNM